MGIIVRNSRIINSIIDSKSQYAVGQYNFCATGKGLNKIDEVLVVWDAAKLKKGIPIPKKTIKKNFLKYAKIYILY